MVFGKLSVVIASFDRWHHKHFHVYYDYICVYVEFVNEMSMSLNCCIIKFDITSRFHMTDSRRHTQLHVKTNGLNVDRQNVSMSIPFFHLIFFASFTRFHHTYLQKHIIMIMVYIYFTKGSYISLEKFSASNRRMKMVDVFFSYLCLMLDIILINPFHVYICILTFSWPYKLHSNIWLFLCLYNV